MLNMFQLRFLNKGYLRKNTKKKMTEKNKTNQLGFIVLIICPMSIPDCILKFTDYWVSLANK